MSRHVSSLTTRTARPAAPAAADARHLVAPRTVVTSPETRLEYRVERLLGAGGFGQAYLATRLETEYDVLTTLTNLPYKLARWVDRDVVPYYKVRWGRIKRVNSVDDWNSGSSFKERRYA